MSRRLLLIVMIGILAIGCLGAVGAVGLIIVTKPSFNQLNPFESFAMRVSLAVRAQDLKTRFSSDLSAICFVIKPGDNATTIAANLANQGLIKDADLFRTYLRYYGLDANLQAATYSFHKSITIPELAQALSEPGANTVNFQSIEGWRIEQVATQIDNTPGLTFNSADFMRVVGAGVVQPDFVQAFAQRASIPPGRSLEGFLYPATYTLPACATAAQLVQRMLNEFDTNITDQMRADAKAKGFTLYQIVTLASIVEREAVVDDERPVIASVYLNRFLNSQKPTPDAAIPSTLDADPTIQYAIGNTRDASRWWPDLKITDLRGVDSPYNTYTHIGLPPGPIANPRLSSIKGVIYPQVTDYLFFRACPNENGRHRFAKTFAEQLSNACS